MECLILTSFYFIEPFKRGFFCNDESLMHPYRESTVALSLGYVGFGLPIIVIIMTEFLRWKTNVNETQNIKLFNRDIPTWLVNVYKNFGTFLFGAFVTILITDTGKLVIGRLRPHFMAVCQPIMANGTNCSDQRNIHRYIEDYSCSNTMSTAEKLRDTKLSFPSGHSSFALYTMVYAAFYIHYLMSWTGSKFVKYLLEFIFISLAWFTALSRISDYKHHCKLTWLSTSFKKCLKLKF